MPTAASLLLCTLLGTAAALPARADAVWMAVSNRTLDKQRGGFEVGAGLLVSFGITRAVYVNGDLVTQTSLNFGRVADLTPAQATQLARQMTALNLVQVGPRNSVAPDVLANGTGTIIQNTLNNQRIVNQTVINARSNAAGMIKSLNTQHTLSDALNRSAAGR
ncbi:hypothetical protein H6CHR_03010 [Variovorax sp. PBL-H6]|uniref:hypothetical protein n=1 Tax=Variovorax sp. PBL-H6 TaxID=434009 RepID=UPI0013174FAE|nr:hypothetical protein [Variovorax sp. PBL-H6]VTU28530.1 hypothetical protein H6CHR_03010 [Variovorax sp. PBL-H6]